MKENKIPIHVGLIMDGNGRWATERGLDRTCGHEAGYKTLKKLATHILKKGIKYLSVYAFSTANFKREKKEVDYLMNMFVTKFKKEENFFMEKNIKVVFSGIKENLRKDVIDSMNEISNLTKNNTAGVLNILLNYESQTEIVEACKKFTSEVINKKTNIDELNKESFNKYLFHDLPPIDFVIRTSGEYRLSNFMLYQLANAELYFPEIYFPDFDEKEFDKALIVYSKRDRRLGGTTKKD